jgi:hypothetical protein
MRRSLSSGNREISIAVPTIVAGTASGRRKQTFERVIADGLEVGGGHLLAPGFARVERAGTAYRIVPSDT